MFMYLLLFINKNFAEKKLAIKKNSIRKYVHEINVSKSYQFYYNSLSTSTLATNSLLVLFISKTNR